MSKIKKIKKIVIGICKECFGNIYEGDEMRPMFPDLIECSHCGHPHSISEIYDYLPKHIPKLRFKEGSLRNRKQRSLFKIRWKNAVRTNQFYL